MRQRIERADLRRDAHVQPLGRDDRYRPDSAARLDQRGPELLDGVSDGRDDAHPGNHHTVHEAAFASTRAFTALATSPMVWNSNCAGATFSPGGRIGIYEPSEGSSP